MKKLFAILLGAALLLLLVGCTDTSEAVELQPFMVKVEECNSFSVCYQYDTKVMYAISNGVNNTGTVTVLLNADGTPMVWEGADVG